MVDRGSPRLGLAAFCLTVSSPSPRRRWRRPLAVPLSRKLKAIIDGPDYKHATWGILVVDAKTGETVFAKPRDDARPGVRHQALHLCRSTHRPRPGSTAETAVYQRGLVANGTLRGDLILVAAGDLTFGGRTKDGKTVFKNNDHTYANSGLGEMRNSPTPIRSRL